jgi:hypothetical protein
MPVVGWQPHGLIATANQSWQLAPVRSVPGQYCWAHPPTMCVARQAPRKKRTLPTAAMPGSWEAGSLLIARARLAITSSSSLQIALVIK